MTIRVAVLITTQPGKAEEQVAAFDLIKDAVRAEEGCIQYDLNRVTNQPWGEPKALLKGSPGYSRQIINALARNQGLGNSS